MSGHNKWAKIKHVKAKTDATRGRVFTRLIKEITVAARMGGGDETSNPRLRKAILDARNQNMPASNIERAIKKGTGELEGVTYEEVSYEGYGAGGAAFIIDLVTDNKNRAVSEIRHVFSKHSGSMAEAGAVTWMFDKKGIIAVHTDGRSEDELMMLALEAGAEDLKYDTDMSDILTAPGDFDAVRESIQKFGIRLEEATLGMYPKNLLKLEGKDAEQTLKLAEALEELDDVQRVFSNFDVGDEVLSKSQAA